MEYPIGQNLLSDQNSSQTWSIVNRILLLAKTGVGLGLGGTMAQYCITACSEECSLASNLHAPQRVHPSKDPGNMRSEAFSKY